MRCRGISAWIGLNVPRHSTRRCTVVPRTYCDERVRMLAPGARRGDGDPLDICVLSERSITQNQIIVRYRAIGGLQMIDGGEATKS